VRNIGSSLAKAAIRLKKKDRKMRTWHAHEWVGTWNLKKENYPARKMLSSQGWFCNYNVDFCKKEENMKMNLKSLDCVSVLCRIK
jgi:hypothetical protein